MMADTLEGQDDDDEERNTRFTGFIDGKKKG
jgi:hypothetical protein